MAKDLQFPMLEIKIAWQIGCYYNSRQNFRKALECYEACLIDSIAHCCTYDQAF